MPAGRKILDRQKRSAKPLAPCSVTERRGSSRIGGRRTNPPEKRAKSTGLLFERLDALPRRQVRALDERLEATMREMGVTFDIARERPWGRRPWFCDVLPQIFTPEEWEPLESGISQRLRAFELFLRDIYGKKEILKANLLPIQPVLGSTAYQRAAASLTPAEDAYLHLSGISLCRVPSGEFAVKQHYFSNASGISYMIQNRRALARVIPQSFQDFSIRSIADAPVDVLELLRSLSDHPDPTVVLLSSGPGSAVYSEHSFLARQMGIPLVQGGDLLVFNDAVFLKTVSGLEKVEVIYNRISDQWLDPMVFRRDSLLGCRGTRPLHSEGNGGCSQCHRLAALR